MTCRCSRFLRLTLTLFVCSQSHFAQQPTKTESFKPYLSCEFDDGVIKETTKRGSSAEDFLEVKIGNETRKVSVIDGYRVMFAYKGARYLFANMKIERSDPKESELDKAKLVEQLKYFVATEKPKLIYRDRTLINGFESYGIDCEVMDCGGVIGTTSSFSMPSIL